LASVPQVSLSRLEILTIQRGSYRFSRTIKHQLTSPRKGGPHDRIVLSLWIGGLVAILSCASAWAQATAEISGTARDQSGAVLPGVELTATQTDTGIVRNTITNETGSYVLPNLAIGPYRLEAALPGFRTYAQTGIVLQVNSSPTINVVLEVGQVAETVEVQANAALVENADFDSWFGDRK
jgi:hypothetical protein